MISATFSLSTTNLAALPHDHRPHIAMVGRSNVGKSSLINHLTQQINLARTSSAPGRTQTMNLYEIDKKFFLVDLPGYGYAKTSHTERERFGEMICDYLEQTEQLCQVLLIIDARIPLSDLDAEMLTWLETHSIPFTIVMNKIDKARPAELQKLHHTLSIAYPGAPRIEHAVTEAKYRNALWNTINESLRDFKKKS